MSLGARPTADWAEILDQIRQALDAALAETATREDELPCAEEEPGSPAALADMETRVGTLLRLADMARRKQLPQDAALAEGEERLRRWLADALAVRQRLAEWASRPVG